MGHEALALQSALDLHQTRLEQGPSVHRADVFPDDQVDVTRIILERDERDTTRRRRFLPRGDEPGDGHTRPIVEMRKLGRPQDTTSLERRTQECERMSTEREPEMPIVGDEIFALGRRGQQR